jgi:hypothetical protein
MEIGTFSCNRITTIFCHTLNGVYVAFIGEKKKSHSATRHCSYGTCNSDSRYSDREHMKGVFLDPVSQTKANLEKMRIGNPIGMGLPLIEALVKGTSVEIEQC